MDLYDTFLDNVSKENLGPSIELFFVRLTEILRTQDRQEQQKTLEFLLQFLADLDSQTSPDPK